MEVLELKELLLTLPPYVDAATVEKRQVSPEEWAKRAASLKGQQQAIYAALSTFVKQPEGGMFLLRGYAGTGKSYLISTLTEKLILDDPYQNIAVTAPTNKAVKVLKEGAEFTHKALTYKTIHKLCGLKQDIDAYGVQKFLPEWGTENELDSTSILFIDEVSMLPDDIFKIVQPYVEKVGLKIIFVGDPAQIPPVGKNDCMPFDKRQQEKYNIQVADLTEIIRQAQGNPIIELTMQLRKGRELNDPIGTRETQLLPDGTGVIFLDADHKELFLAIIKTYFCSENFQKDSDYVHIICWRNAAVDKFNSIVRGYIYGKERAKAEALIVGEKLIANKPIFEDYDGRQVIVFNNNDEFVVEKFTEDVWPAYKYFLKYFATWVIREDGSKEKIKILHPEAEQQYIDLVNTLAEIARSKGKGTFQARTAWADFYNFQNTFADVSYNYACSIHKSQGSTYENAIVIESDVDGNPKTVERNRIKYTAFSRPRSKLFIIN